MEKSRLLGSIRVIGFNGMKKILLPIVLSCLMLPAWARNLEESDFDGYTGVERYTRGSLAIAKALNASQEESKYYYEDAIEYLETYKEEQEGKPKFYKNLEVVVSPESDVEKSDLGVRFDYDFAKSMYPTDTINRPVLEVRDTTLNKALCAVKNMAIKPGGEITLEAIQDGNSFVLLVSDKADALGLEVQGSQTLQAETVEDGFVQYCHWNEPEEIDVKYIITNKSDNPVAFVVICN